MNRTVFYAYVRRAPFGGRFRQLQVDGMNAILDYWEQWSKQHKVSDLRWLAYMLATAAHETGFTMQPVRETFATSDAQAIARLNKAWAAGKLKWVSKPYWRTGFFGRGLPQLTHERNYRIMGEILKLDLVGNPSLMLQMDVAVKVMFEGMTRALSMRGDFTGRSLDQYFNATTDDPVGARATVNGNDKAKLIAGYHKNFLDALKKAEEAGTILPDDVKPEDAKPDEAGGVWELFKELLRRMFSSGST